MEVASSAEAAALWVSHNSLAVRSARLFNSSIVFNIEDFSRQPQRVSTRLQAALDGGFSPTPFNGIAEEGLLKASDDEADEFVDRLEGPLRRLVRQVERSLLDLTRDDP